MSLVEVVAQVKYLHAVNNVLSSAQNLTLLKLNFLKIALLLQVGVETGVKFLSWAFSARILLKHLFLEEPLSNFKVFSVCDYFIKVLNLFFNFKVGHLSLLIKLVELSVNVHELVVLFHVTRRVGMVLLEAFGLSHSFQSTVEVSLHPLHLSEFLSLLTPLSLLLSLILQELFPLHQGLFLLLVKELEVFLVPNCLLVVADLSLLVIEGPGLLEL